MNDELNENELESVLGGVPYEYGKDSLNKVKANESLSESELEAVIGGVPYETGKEAAELLKDAKRRIIASDANKDGKLVGEEIENANLGDYIKENSKSI